ncbi:MAG TPA: hypothetical protein VND93_29295, partial [Myxococcales bacterium]|nr:hypothetical protein [Myxococcales bacterium]
PAGMSSVVQASGGVTFHPALGVDFSVDGYWDPMLRAVELSPLQRDIWDEVFAGPTDAAPQVAAKVTQGSALGMELLLRKSLGDRLTGWISYSVQRSVRAAEGKDLPFALEQTHVLNAVVAWRLPGGWTLGGAVLLRSGAPEVGSLLASPTQVPGTDAAGAPAWVRAPVDQVDRLPGLLRVDARASKAFDLDPLRLELWLDVYDISLGRDVLSFSYGTAIDPGTGQRVLTKGANGLWYPLPMLGLRGAWKL